VAIYFSSLGKPSDDSSKRLEKVEKFKRIIILNISKATVILQKFFNILKKKEFSIHKRRCKPS